MKKTLKLHIKKKSNQNPENCMENWQALQEKVLLNIKNVFNQKYNEIYSKNKKKPHKFHKQTFRKWVNYHLKKSLGMNAPIVNDLFKDLQNGVILMQLLTALFGSKVRIPKYNTNPQMKVHSLDNVSQALNILETVGIKNHFLKPASKKKLPHKFQKKKLFRKLRPESILPLCSNVRKQKNLG